MGRDFTNAFSRDFMTPLELIYLQLSLELFSLIFFF